MDQGKFTTDYLSVGANRHTAAADWNEDGLVAFGADLNIALWRPQSSSESGIESLWAGHRDVPKAVKFLPTIDGEKARYLITGGDDKCLKIWQLDQSLASCVQTVEEHTAPINCIATLGSLEQGRARIFVTGAADASVKVWSFRGPRGGREPEAKLLQTIKSSTNVIPLCLALSELGEDGDALVLAIAGTRETVQVLVAESAADPEFKLQATLSGHEGWVRSLDFSREKSESAGEPRSDLMLASASQDKYVRLWRFRQGMTSPAAAVAVKDYDPILGAFQPTKCPSNKVHRLSTGDKEFWVTFEALLSGHDDWIYSARWFKGQASLRLLTTSADNTLTIWEADLSSSIWVSVVRLGEISREKGATTATGSTGGFWTGLWSPDGCSVLALCRTGSWRRWDYSQQREQWLARIGVGGHTRAVTGIAWSSKGEYLLSTSSDQTTRLHAPRQTGDARKTWHEMARPQIHGYDLNCIDSIGSSQFVSGADEKLMRVFKKPKAVAQLLGRLCDISNQDMDDLPDGADMPALGLSNKAVETRTGPDREVEVACTNDLHSAVLVSVLDADHPPTEDELSRYTLWPEIEKLYGHGYEISCLAVSHDGSVVASACKASSANHAVLRLFETERWTELRPPLSAHSLTVTRLRFSPCDKYLLSVGRDRRWAVFERTEDDCYILMQTNPKAHARMILDAAWAPVMDRLVFATAGRDKMIKTWTNLSAGEAICMHTITLSHPATAVDFLPSRDASGRLVLAFGTEAGRISIQHLDMESLNPVGCLQLAPEQQIARSVSQLAWRPGTIDMELAVAGEDGSLRVYSYPTNA